MGKRKLADITKRTIQPVVDSLLPSSALPDIEDSFTAYKDTEKSHLRKGLLAWYHTSRRKLPWRGDDLLEQEEDNDDMKKKTKRNGSSPAFSPSAYGTWVSEVMLQQTRVETVIPYWYRWMETFPTVAQLAKASPDEVNVLWAGLGYYRRAQQLLLGAKEVVNTFNGDIPSTVEELRTIPGIGPYTAGAISSIAFNQPAPLVDGNVIRVFSRLRALKEETGGKLEKVCWSLAAELIDQKQPGDFNQGTYSMLSSYFPHYKCAVYDILFAALMELGATVCKPTSSDCAQCPLQSLCLARQQFLASPSEQNEVTMYPVKAPKKKPKELSFSVCVFAKNNVSRKKSEVDNHVVEYLFMKREGRGLLANQWEFPTVPLSADEEHPVGIEELWGGFPAHLREKCNMETSFDAQISSSSFSSTPNVLRVRASSLRCAVNSPIVHVFSHQIHTMHVILCEVEDFEASSLDSAMDVSEAEAKPCEVIEEARGSLREFRWMSADDIVAAGLTSGCKKILSSLATSEDKPSKVKDKLNFGPTVKGTPLDRNKTTKNAGLSGSLDGWLRKK